MITVHLINILHLHIDITSHYTLNTDLAADILILDSTSTEIFINY